MISVDFDVSPHLSSNFGGMSVSDAKQLKKVAAENARLKRLLANFLLEIEITKEALQKGEPHQHDVTWCGIWFNED